MFDADEAIVAPAAQQFAGIDDKGVFEQRRPDPLLAWFAEDAEPGAVLRQDGTKGGVDVRRDAELVLGQVTQHRVVRHA